MNVIWTLAITVFIGSSCLVMLLYLLLPGGRQERLAVRVQALSGEGAVPGVDFLRHRKRVKGIKGVLPALSVPLVPEDKEEQHELKTRLVQAGLYAPQAISLYLGTKMLLCMGLLLAGLSVWILGMVSFPVGLCIGAGGGIVGLIGPSFWLDSRKAARQNIMRKALPDGMDLLVVCLEGGNSLLSGMQRVAREVRTAHPLLAAEWGLVLRATEMGQSNGDALKQLAARFDLEELRRLASIVTESERFGTSVGKALRAMAQSMRFQRHQRAEEQARQAEVKMLFPTVLFILPCIFLVVLFPSAIRIMQLFSAMGVK